MERTRVSSNGSSGGPPPTPASAGLAAVSPDARLRIATATGQLALWEYRRSHGVASNPELNRLLGFAPDARPSLAQLEAKMPGELDRLRNAAFAAMELGGQTFELEIGCNRSPDDHRWLLVRADVLFDANGQPNGALGVIIDITERKRAEERVRLLAREVDHRANNLLTVIEGIVTLAQEADADALKAAIIGRIEALAGAHRLMAASRWQSANLRRLLEQELGAYLLGHAGRVSLNGPEVSLGPEQAQTLAMVFHELATNAGKYGSLSVAEGSVDIDWAFDEQGLLAICWRERGGPPVQPPKRRGFGTTLITRALADTLGARAEITWREEGLICEIALPGLRRLPAE
jgi:PAS domain S-box-containing protein